MTKLICGLGNPGREYAQNRHNVGFHVVDALAEGARIGITQEKFEARVGAGNLGGEKIVLLEPQTFMNLSGRAVVAACQFYKIQFNDVLVIHDELDLPFGRLQLKNGGGAGGHNGIKSILELAGTDAFTRLRFGVGKPRVEGESIPPEANKGRVVGHVLGNFDSEEREALRALIERSVDMAQTWAKDGLAVAMNRFNRAKA